MNNLEELKRKYEELGKEIERLEKEKKDKRWRAKKIEDDYYYIDSFGYIYEEIEENEKRDDFRYKTRNYFKTKEQAQEHLENINTYYDLMDLAEELNNGEIIDWNNLEQNKYSIYYDIKDKEFFSADTIMFIDLGQIYCLNEDFLNIALEKIGKERLEKLFKGGANYGI